jgi:hypothetical protein
MNALATAWMSASLFRGLTAAASLKLVDVMP